VNNPRSHNNLTVVAVTAKREMMTRTKPGAPFLSIALALMLAPVVSGTQQADLGAAAAAKAATCREARTDAAIEVPGLNADGTFIKFDVPGDGTTGSPIGLGNRR
jgi:hypothetical protein